MFHRDLMVRADNGSLEQTPDVLKRIRMRQTANILFPAVVNSHVDRVVIAHTKIASLLVGRQHLGFIRKFSFQKSAQFVFGERASTCVMQPNLAVTLNRSENDFLVMSAAALSDTASLLVRLVHPLRFAANVGFISLDKAR